MFTYTLFNGVRIVSQGELETVALAARREQKNDIHARLLLFSDTTGRQIDLDLSGSEKELLERMKIYSPIPIENSHRVGRPKLGVKTREVSLLPHHWEWLLNQDGGTSLILRKLIDEKIKASSKSPEKLKAAQEATYKFLSALAGNLPHFEEAARYLFRKDQQKFAEQMKDWPKDIVKYANKLAEAVFD